MKVIGEPAGLKDMSPFRSPAPRRVVAGNMPSFRGLLEREMLRADGRPALIGDREEERGRRPPLIGPARRLAVFRGPFHRFPSPLLPGAGVVGVVAVGLGKGQ